MAASVERQNYQTSPTTFEFTVVEEEVETKTKLGHQVSQGDESNLLAFQPNHRVQDG